MAILVHSALCDAMETSLVQVETCFTRGFAGLQLIGHTSEVCRNGLERAKAVLELIGVKLPQRKMIVSMSPAELKKDGSQYDMSFAVGLGALVLKKKLKVDLRKWIFLGELGLNGDLKRLPRVISYLLLAQEQNMEGVVIPSANFEEIEFIKPYRETILKNLKIMLFDDLSSVYRWLLGGGGEKEGVANHGQISKTLNQVGVVKGYPRQNYDDMALNPDLELLATLVASGGHSLLVTGNPGCGKTMFLERISSVFPKLDSDELLESVSVYGYDSQLPPADLLTGRIPFRCPHHQSSSAAVLGTPDSPGEISLAHGGVLFLDEFVEFRRDLLEGLREPLESGQIYVSRSKAKALWPARFTLVAACNPCPCGWLGSEHQMCRCSTTSILAYQRKLSGPILDRIDIHFKMSGHLALSPQRVVEVATKSSKKNQSHNILSRVEKARNIAELRNKKFGITLNSFLTAAHIYEALGLSSESLTHLTNKFIPQSCSSRAYLKILKVARTLADIYGRKQVNGDDIKQSVLWQYDQKQAGLL